MKKKILIDYWNKFYKTKSITAESTFAKFTFKKIINKKSKLLDIGCGNGRDSYYFNRKGLTVIGIDISQKAIQKNSKNKIKNLSFKKFDIGKNKIKGKFDVIYCRFFVHTVDELLEDKLIKLISFELPLSQIKKCIEAVIFDINKYNSANSPAKLNISIIFE